MHFATYLYFTINELILIFYFKHADKRAIWLKNHFAHLCKKVFHKIKKIIIKKYIKSIDFLVLLCYNRNIIRQQ